jgi:hypothetical protein
MATRRYIADQVLFRLDASSPEVSQSVQLEDVYAAISQWVNDKFKFRHLSETLSSGESIPEGSSLATYSDVAVVSDGDTASVTLPVMPISLPRNLGVYNVSGGGYNFIPLQRGQLAMLGADFLLNTLFGQVAYEVVGKKIKFSKNIKLLGINTVDLDLMVFDMSIYNDTDALPIPSDMESSLVNDLYKMFAPIQPMPSVVSNFPQPMQNK